MKLNANTLQSIAESILKATCVRTAQDQLSLVRLFARNALQERGHLIGNYHNIERTTVYAPDVASHLIQNVMGLYAVHSAMKGV